MALRPIQPTPTGNDLPTGRAGYNSNHKQQNPPIRKATLGCQLAIPTAWRKSRRQLYCILWRSICMQTRQHITRRIPDPHDTHKSIKDGAALPYLLVDWRSWKLPRMPRSSLSAEAQAASETADAMMYNITFWQLIWHPTPASDDITACQLRNKPCIVTDAKALYDLLTKQELQPNSAWSRQTNVCGTTRHTRQAQMHAGRDKMGLIRATIHRRHDKSISSSTTCPAATHTLHQHQARRTVHSSKKEKRSRQEEKR